MRVHVGSLAALPANRCLAVGDGRAVVVRVADEVVAFANRCLHQDSPLAEGWVSDGVLTCPLHFWRYQLPQGAHVGTGATLPGYPVEVVNGTVFVDVPDPEPKRSMRELLLEHASTWERDR